MKLPSSPVLTGLGGVNASYSGNEVSTAINNPSLLKPELHGQVHAGFNFFLAGIKAFNAGGSYHLQKRDISLGGHIFFVDYGSIPQTDASGNETGNFRPVDFIIQVSGAKKYQQNWNYGGSLKFIHSGYGQYQSSGIAMDAGLLFEDSTKGFAASVLVKNMGFQLSAYAGEKEDLPFDLQLGLTKRLSGAPLGFSVTAHHLHRFNILYDDTTFNNDNGYDSKPGFLAKTLNHFVVNTHLYLGSNLEAMLGFNHLRRQELNIATGGNGLNGFSLGLRAKFNKMEFQYGRSNYQRNISYHHLGLTLKLPELVSGL